MRVLLVGVNHRAASVSIRERLAIPDAVLQTRLAELREMGPKVEAVILSTCNRTELYVAKPHHEAPDAEVLRSLLAKWSGLSVAEVQAATVHREQDEAVRHLFRVATGLDSRIVGEPQILGQVRRAYDTANAHDTLGPTLHKVFQQALATAKQLRHRTGLGTAPSSTGRVAARFAQQVFDRFDDKTILAVGAGEMIQASLPALMDLNPRKLWLVNRTTERAQTLADDVHLSEDRGGARAWDDLDRLLLEADFVITCTAAGDPILTASQYKPIAKKRRYRPTCLADLGVPRDIDPAVGSLRNVYLYNIDDLQGVIAQGQAEDQALAERCEPDIRAAARACLSAVEHRDIGRLIRSLRTRLHDLAAAEQTRTLRKLQNRSDPDQLDAALREHSHRLINKFLHLPLSQLDEHDPQAPLGFYAAALRRLFDLDESASPAEKFLDPEPPQAENMNSNRDEPLAREEALDS